MISPTIADRVRDWPTTLLTRCKKAGPLAGPGVDGRRLRFPLACFDRCLGAVEAVERKFETVEHRLSIERRHPARRTAGMSLRTPGQAPPPLTSEARRATSAKDFGVSPRTGLDAGALDVGSFQPVRRRSA
jgi:hypothetical protein